VRGLWKKCQPQQLRALHITPDTCHPLPRRRACHIKNSPLPAKMLQLEEDLLPMLPSGASAGPGMGLAQIQVTPGACSADVAGSAACLLGAAMQEWQTCCMACIGMCGHCCSL
jgi:hypothetical protein